jgi:hypothetical protein
MAFSRRWRRRRSHEKRVIARPKGDGGEYPKRENQESNGKRPSRIQI